MGDLCDEYFEDDGAAAGEHYVPPVYCGRQALDEALGPVRVDTLPATLRCAFPFSFFNAIQSECFDVAFRTDENIVVSSPTGTGKTGVLELALLRMADSGRFAQGQKGVYMAPTRALCGQQIRSWEKRLGAQGVGLKIFECTGESEFIDNHKLQQADIIVTTPEKFDAMTRKGQKSGKIGWLGDIALLLVDEVHMLGSDRGPTLEAVIARLKLAAQSAPPDLAVAGVRFVAVSATIPNADSIAKWLGVAPANLRKFGNEVRATDLRVQVLGYGAAKNEFLFDMNLTRHVFKCIQDFSKGKPALVFCTSRKQTQQTAERIVEDARGGLVAALTPPQRAELSDYAAAVAGKNRALAATMKQGAGYHNAALSPEERGAVEAAFLRGLLRVVCATGTLAVGVNLPAHLVVIKNTRLYAGGKYVEYDPAALLQMAGRAGRPDWDTEGVCVVMAPLGDVPRLRESLGGAQVVESCMLGQVLEHLNAEIVLGGVRSLAGATSWLRSTFLATRMAEAPERYGDGAVEARAAAAVARLVEVGLAEMRGDESGGGVSGPEARLTATEAGRIMSLQYVRFATMQRIMATVREQGGVFAESDQMWCITDSEELSTVTLRRSEKKALNAMHKEPGLLPHIIPRGPNAPDKPKERVATAREKAFLLLSAALSDGVDDRLDWSLRSEMQHIVRNAARLSTAMRQFYQQAGVLGATIDAALLARSLAVGCRRGGLELIQVPGIGRVIAKRLGMAGVRTLRQLRDTDPRRVELLSGKPYPFGTRVTEHVRQELAIPDVATSVHPQASSARKLMHVEVRLRVDAEGGSEGGTQAGAAQTHARRTRGLVHVFAGLISNQKLVLSREVNVFAAAASGGESFKLTLDTPPGNQPLQLVTAVLPCDVVGFDSIFVHEIPRHGGASGAAERGVLKRKVDATHTLVPKTLTPQKSAPKKQPAPAKVAVPSRDAAARAKPARASRDGDARTGGGCCPAADARRWGAAAPARGAGSAG
ncbi:unnamed protein product [Pedinophyceae sp. YPF-701]|nr:unnamed protein product [Pedinophyceae sp. YPF-701]